MICLTTAWAAGEAVGYLRSMTQPRLLGVHIGIGACCWSNQRGFGRFTRELVPRMLEQFPGHDFTLVADRWTAEDAVFPGRARLEVVDTDAQPTRAASAAGARTPMDIWRLARAVSRVRCDVFFFPAVYSFYPILRRVPTVVTFHDATAEAFPGLIFPSRRSRLFWNLKTWLARKQADRLVAVSTSAKNEIARTFHYPAASIHVVSEGPSECFRPLDRAGPEVAHVRQRYGLPSEAPLVLYVGGISPHKNLDELLHAFSRLRRETVCHLVLVGDHANDSFYGCYPSLLGLCERLGLETSVTFTGFVPDEDLVALYSSATILVLPSLNEGFGLPAVEAMACGLPVAASDRGSLPEVLKTAGLYFDPNDREQMAGVMGLLLRDSDLRAELSSRDRERAREFSWDAAARDAVAVLEQLAS